MLLLLLSPSSAMQPVARSTRRSVVLQGVACATCIGFARPASASLNIDLREAEGLLTASTGGESTDAALNRLLAIR